MPGLYLDITPAGKKIFRFRFNGKKAKLGEGHTNIKGVKEEYYKWRHAVDSGREPWDEKESEKNKRKKIKKELDIIWAQRKKGLNALKKLMKE